MMALHRRSKSIGCNVLLKWKLFFYSMVQRWLNIFVFKRCRKSIKIILACITLSSMLLIILTGLEERNRLINIPKAKANISDKRENNSEDNKPPGKLFLYLIQTANCVHDDIISELGDSKSYDVLVLSYKSPCNERKYQHVQYITVNEKTTWTSGRNFLYRYLFNSSINLSYIYYTFMDEDIYITESTLPQELNITINDEWKKILNSKESIYKKYERFLDEYRPAIGVIDYKDNIKRIWPDVKPHPVSPYGSSFYFDAMFNSFHKDVIHRLLPYDETFENESWWISQQLMQCKVYIRYYSQMIMFYPFTALNKQHSAYPQGLRHSGSMCTKELDSAPKKVSSSPIAQKLLKTGYLLDVAHVDPSPPKTPFIEYVLFANNY